MLGDFHFLRPWWWIAFVPILLLIWLISHKKPGLGSWESVCDANLLAHLLQTQIKRTGTFTSLLCIWMSLFFILISLTGPTWKRLPVPTYQPTKANVLLLDLSTNMLKEDLSPNRLARAKFKLQDLLAQKAKGQFGLVVYTSEPFVVSPLTEDGLTITALLPTLMPDIVPVQGQNLKKALKEGAQLIEQAGFNEGQLLVLTGEPPSKEAIQYAEDLAVQGIFTSILPMRTDTNLNPLFEELANAGQGLLLPFSSSSQDIDTWLASENSKSQFKVNTDSEFPAWRDEGRLFLVPALLFLLPIFRRGWLQRIDV